MPRIVIKAGTPARRSNKLVSKLAEEIATPGEGPLPLIIERYLPKAKSRQVYVIWDEWEDLDDEERSAVIVTAYAKTESEDFVSSITVALGLNPEEAVIYGVLPYMVHPARRKDSEKEEYRKAIAEEAARAPLRDRQGSLRYPTIEEAGLAQKRLMKLLPRSSWLIVKETDEE